MTYDTLAVYAVAKGGRLLSGGQRLALARGLIRQRKIVLLDEGTSSLDKKTTLEIENKLVNEDNLTVIMITHHLDKTIEDKLDGILQLKTIENIQKIL